ncbi:ATP/GTP-binding protein [Streptomyces sp. HNM0574]|uniref:ATP/GTP-binding protein n=1 Tax=Streptomyces sp. HNM0574 TaxID=2714954 RepID=UPI00146AD709|nr:ATP/GTP-binding protein [Streptomyces sp. HNM0574]
MSPRHNRPRGRSGKSGKRGAEDSAARRDEAGERYGLERSVEWQGEEWAVRQISGNAASKHYRCPGCDQEIPPGVPHVVAWALMGDGDDRRHWHKSCWNARDRRSAKLQRSRNAPRH